MSKHRAHLEAVIASARLRGESNDCVYSTAALEGIDITSNTQVQKLSRRVAALKLSLFIETPAGDKEWPTTNPEYIRAKARWTA